MIGRVVRSSIRAGRMARCVFLFAAGFAVLPLTLAQSINGRWVGVDRVMDNGEEHKTILELHQAGNKISGKMETLGWTSDVSGTANGNHFQLFQPWDTSKVLLTGELAGNELHITQHRQSLVYKPATSAADLPKVPYIEPPPLHKVPSNGLAKKPPMGWNSWNLFAEKVDDATVRTIADAMVSSGMRDAGYIYVNIDDTWEGVRDAQGVLPANHKFPDMKALADYVHSKGLKLGIYSSPGPRTCGGYPGSYGHEAQDAKTWADWGIDYVKYDWCSAGQIYKDEQLQPVYQKMGEALQATGRPIVFSLCEYGKGEVEKWGPDVGGNLWRTTGDIRDEWSSMIENAELQIKTAPYAGPGHWNDPDMLEIGNGHMTNDEYRTHMSLWSMLASPLLAGNDVRNMSQATKDILLNKDVIAIDQDELGKQATRIAKAGDVETWTKALADGGVAVAVFNHGTAPTKVTVKSSDVHVSDTAKARDLWTHKDVAFAQGNYSDTVPKHGVLLLRISSAK